MKKVLFAVITAVVCSSCVFTINNNGSKMVRCGGEITSRDMQLSGFDAITVNGSADIDIIQGDSWSVIVTANEEVFQYLDYKVNGKEFVIETVDHVNIKAEKYEIVVTVPELVSMVVNGASDADLKGGYTSDKDLTIEVNGAGDFDLVKVKVPSISFTVNGAGDIDVIDMDVDTVSVEVNGAGDIRLTGKANHGQLSVSGAGDIDASGLDCGSLATHKRGMAKIKVKE